MAQLDELLNKRYGPAAPSAIERINETIGVLLNHRSVRAYLPDSRDEGTLELLVAAAQSASTSSNLQTWSVVAIEDKERKARLAKLCGDRPRLSVGSGSN